MAGEVGLDRVNEQIEQHGLWWAFHKPLMIELFEALREGLGDEDLVDLEPALEVVADHPFIAWSSQVQQQVRHH